MWKKSLHDRRTEAFDVFNREAMKQDLFLSLLKIRNQSETQDQISAGGPTSSSRGIKI